MKPISDTYTLTYIHTYIHKYIHTYMNTKEIRKCCMCQRRSFITYGKINILKILLNYLEINILKINEFFCCSLAEMNLEKK